MFKRRDGTLRSSKDITEKELAALCAKDDVSAKRELYTRYAARVHMLSAGYLGDNEEAKDLTHDIMMKVFDSIGKYTYKGEGSLYAWIRKITVNAAINKITRRQKPDITVAEEQLLDVKEPSEEEMERIPLSELMNIISSLPDTQRLIMNMFCLEGYSHKEIAHRLGITEKASSSLLSKAKKALAGKIRNYYKKTR